MTRLSVNVNKLATLRNSRGKNMPDVLALSKKILSYGAHGITVHPRPDARHIRGEDVLGLAEVVRQENASGSGNLEFNVEGYPGDSFFDLIAKARPHQVTLVPDPPEALTSNAGWDLSAREPDLGDAIARVRSLGARVSLFVDPRTFGQSHQASLARLKPDRIELYTERYADFFPTPDRDRVTADYERVATGARAIGVGVNAGHDLTQENLSHLIATIPCVEEVSIGHALICESLEQGLENTVRSYLEILERAHAGHSRTARP